jgi:hypothetical protein
MYSRVDDFRARKVTQVKQMIIQASTDQFAKCSDTQVISLHSV